jgi:hypothetical protein
LRLPQLLLLKQALLLLMLVVVVLLQLLLRPVLLREMHPIRLLQPQQVVQEQRSSPQDPRVSNIVRVVA